jgi:hypothetical protein
MCMVSWIILLYLRCVEMLIFFICWVKWKMLLQIISPVSFFFYNVATWRCKAMNVAWVIFLLGSFGLFSCWVLKNIHCSPPPEVLTQLAWYLWRWGLLPSAKTATCPCSGFWGTGQLSWYPGLTSPTHRVSACPPSSTLDIRFCFICLSRGSQSHPGHPKDTKPPVPGTPCSAAVSPP